MKKGYHEFIYYYSYRLLDIELKDNEGYNLSDLAKDIGTRRQEKNFIEFVKLMKEKKIIKIYEKTETLHLLKEIDKKALLEFIPTLPLNYEFHQFIKEWEGKEIYKYVKDEED